VETSYLNVYKFESSQNEESRALMANPSKAFIKTRAFELLNFQTWYYFIKVLVYNLEKEALLQMQILQNFYYQSQIVLFV